jgi:hypothetical protein
MTRGRRQVPQAPLIVSGEFVSCTTPTATESLWGPAIPIAVRAGSDDTQIAAIEQDQPLLWSQTDDRQLKSPDRQLLEQIAAGELDGHLVAITDAVHARRELLHTARAAAAIAELCVGDTVVFTGRIRPRYLEHELAVIQELEDHWVAVRLWHPVGRFRDGTVRCPPLALRKVAPQP